MFYRCVAAPSLRRALHLKRKALLALLPILALPGTAGTAFAQSLERELDAPERVEIAIKNFRGRVAVIASAEQQKKVFIRAESPNAPLSEEDVRSSVTGRRVEVTVTAARAGQNDLSVNKSSGDSEARTRSDSGGARIDLQVRVPSRTRVSVETAGGAVDVVGAVESAEVTTETGTIRADVPLDALKYNFQWTASRPRFFSEVELPEVKEKRGGIYEIAGWFGDRKAKKESVIKLNLMTERGVVLFGVSDPQAVPSDLRERPLTEAVRAIIKNGDEDLTAAIRKVAPRLVGDYTRSLPQTRRSGVPSFTARAEIPAAKTIPAAAADVSAAESFARLTASVTDRHGRAISGLTEKDFSVFENGQVRPVKQVMPTNAPFNLVLLLDVSGSVEERLDFIRKAALAFLKTAGAQDRIAIISFRDDIQIISDFTSDRQLLSERIKKIEAGGGTALYDALAYALVHTLKPLRGERTAVVILSDGDDNKSFLPFSEVLEATIESGALVYPLYIPSGLAPTESSAAPEATLDPTRARYLTLTSRAEEEGRKLASVSGGVYYPVTRLDQLQRAYDDVVAQLRTSYTVTYTSITTGSGGDEAAAARRRNPQVRVRVEREGAQVRLSPVVSIAAP